MPMDIYGLYILCGVDICGNGMEITKARAMSNTALKIAAALQQQTNTEIYWSPFFCAVHSVQIKIPIFFH